VRSDGVAAERTSDQGAFCGDPPTEEDLVSRCSAGAAADDHSGHDCVSDTALQSAEPCARLGCHPEERSDGLYRAHAREGTRPSKGAPSGAENPSADPSGPR